MRYECEYNSGVLCEARTRECKSCGFFHKEAARRHALIYREAKKDGHFHQLKLKNKKRSERNHAD